MGVRRHTAKVIKQCSQFGIPRGLEVILFQEKSQNAFVEAWKGSQGKNKQLLVRFFLQFR